MSDSTLVTFGEAIQAVKRGKRIARHGWNGKNMCVYLKRGSVDGKALGFKSVEDIPEDHQSSIAGVKLGLFDFGPTDSVTRLPNLNMQDPAGNTVTGWLASQTDILAEDWEILSDL